MTINTHTTSDGTVWIDLGPAHRGAHTVRVWHDPTTGTKQTGIWPIAPAAVESLARSHQPHGLFQFQPSSAPPARPLTPADLEMRPGARWTTASRSRAEQLEEWMAYATAPSRTRREPAWATLHSITVHGITINLSHLVTTYGEAAVTAQLERIRPELERDIMPVGFGIATL